LDPFQVKGLTLHDFLQDLGTMVHCVAASMLTVSRFV
jgi:hypothetical protein